MKLDFLSIFPVCCFCFEGLKAGWDEIRKVKEGQIKIKSQKKNVWSCSLANSLKMDRNKIVYVDKNLHLEFLQVILLSVAVFHIKTHKHN